jgi:2-iminobutanoate/2-iminopropanoate deaminase
MLFRSLALVLLIVVGAPAAADGPVYLNGPAPAGMAAPPFSTAVRAGDTVYLAGTIGIDAKTGQAPAAIAEEIHLVLENFKKEAELAGVTMDDLVSVQVFCTDLSLFGQFNEVYRTYFHAHFPARAFIGAGSILRGGHFEVLGIAVVPAKK